VTNWLWLKVIHHLQFQIRAKLLWSTIVFHDLTTRLEKLAILACQ
jgi:hypothetical protein